MTWAICGHMPGAVCDACWSSGTARDGATPRTSSVQPEPSPLAATGTPPARGETGGDGT
jgi:hypothetical protein